MSIKKRMQDFYFELESPDGKKQTVSEDENSLSGDSQREEKTRKQKAL